MKRRPSLIVLLAALAALPLAHAADWSFDPVLTLSAERSDDIFASAGAGAGGSQSDTALSLDARLALVARQPRSEFSFIYHPMHEAYQDFSELDNTTHRLHLAYSVQPSRRSEWQAGLSFSRQERQRVDFDAPQQDQVVLPRTRFDALAGSLQLRHSLAPRSRLVLHGAVAANSFDSQVADGVRLDDTSTTSLQLGYEFDTSPLSVVGLSLYGSRLDEGFRGERDVMRLLGVYRRVTERRSLTLSIGAAKTSINDPGEGVSPGVVPDEPTDVVGSLDFQLTLRRNGQFQGGLYRDVTSSGGTGGSSLSRGAFVALRLPAGRWSRFALYGRYAKRDPQDGQAEALDSRTVSYRGEWNASFSRRWSLVLAGERFDQSSDSSSLERAYTIWSLGLRLSPTARGR